MRDISPLLPRILQHGWIARLEGGTLYIGSRKDYPFRDHSIALSSAAEAAAAIRGMVTQGGGQLEVALWAAVLEAKKWGKNLERMEDARTLLCEARKTNTTVMRELEALYSHFASFPERTFAENVEEAVRNRLAEYDENYLRMAQHGSALIEDGMGILTTCFAEHSFFLSLALAREAGKKFTVYAMETRPYLQGAHLTAPALAEMGYEHRLICDNMAAGIIMDGRVDLYMTASDLATRTHWVINKIGTLSAALAAKRKGIPYYAFSVGTDDRYSSLEDFPIEWRDEAEVKACQGMATTKAEVKAIYPAFDIIPPDLVAGIITKEGIL